MRLLFFTPYFLLFWWLIPWLELNGAALATAATTASLTLVRVWEVEWFEGILPFHSSQGKALLAAALSLGLCHLLRPAFAGLGMALYIVLFLLLLRMLGLEAEDRQAWQRFKDRFGKHHN